MLLGAIDLLHICRLKLPAENVVTQISLRTDGIRVSNASLDVSKERIFFSGMKLKEFPSRSKTSRECHKAQHRRSRCSSNGNEDSSTTVRSFILNTGKV